MCKSLTPPSTPHSLLHCQRLLWAGIERLACLYHQCADSNIKGIPKKHSHLWTWLWESFMAEIFSFYCIEWCWKMETKQTFQLETLNKLETRMWVLIIIFIVNLLQVTCVRTFKRRGNTSNAARPIIILLEYISGVVQEDVNFWYKYIN